MNGSRHAKKDYMTLISDKTILVYVNKALNMSWILLTWISRYRDNLNIAISSLNITIFKKILCMIAIFYITIYTRAHKCNHPISKVLQWLAWSAKLWTDQGWSHILLCWGRFLYIPWLFVCQFSRKNLPWNVWEKVTNFGYYIKIHFYVIPKVWNFFPEISAKIFSWKSAYLVPRCIQKNVPNIEVCDFIPGPPSKPL